MRQTTRSEIKGWLERGLENESTHMIVVCDTFSYEDYPVYVSKRQDVRMVAKRYDGRNMQRITEVYSLKRNLENQLNEHRAFHYD